MVGCSKLSCSKLFVFVVACLFVVVLSFFVSPVVFALTANTNNVSTSATVNAFVETSLNATTLAFGSVDPGSTNNANAGSGPIRLTNTANSNAAIDVFINATNLSAGTVNITARNLSVWTSNAATSSTPLNLSPNYVNNSGANNGFYENLAVSGTVDLYFWLDVPAAQTAGSYSGSLNIRVVQDGGTP